MDSKNERVKKCGRLASTVERLFIYQVIAWFQRIPLVVASVELFHYFAVNSHWPHAKLKIIKLHTTKAHIMHCERHRVFASSSSFFNLFCFWFTFANRIVNLVVLQILNTKSFVFRISVVFFCVHACIQLQHEMAKSFQHKNSVGRMYGRMFCTSDKWNQTFTSSLSPSLSTLLNPTKHIRHYTVLVVGKFLIGVQFVFFFCSFREFWVATYYTGYSRCDSIANRIIHIQMWIDATRNVENIRCEYKTICAPRRIFFVNKSNFGIYRGDEGLWRKTWHTEYTHSGHPTTAWQYIGVERHHIPWRWLLLLCIEWSPVDAERFNGPRSRGLRKGIADLFVRWW